MIKWKKNISVGKVNIITNAVLYGICLFLFDVSTVIYSLIYAAVSAFAVDHEHSQNINVEVRIITKLDDMELEQEILQKMDRGITRLESTGAYTNEKSNMLLHSRVQVRGRPAEKHCAQIRSACVYCYE